MCNIAMWHCFVRSLHASNSVAAATLNSCLNLIFTVRLNNRKEKTVVFNCFCFQAVFSVLAFGESLGEQWFLGAAMMSVGTMLVLRGTVTVNDGVAAENKKTR